MRSITSPPPPESRYPHATGLSLAGAVALEALPVITPTPSSPLALHPFISSDLRYPQGGQIVAIQTSLFLSPKSIDKIQFLF